MAVKEGVQNKVTSEDLIEFCRKRMATYKYPRTLEIVSEIPKATTGKFLRHTLRDQEASKGRKT